ncbi:NADPH-dependent FMN reductase [Lewinella sp. W8]|uniref:NADPH-dependent FMN reductase n=1 Tax=Lewinella sp. W8 TaxID=2528208 RepID=UPI001067CD4E|nr:NAD(P)H-dependent oxidoreductase [Lewinella sp. W8]MTB52530.1 NADPH-dependent oxidoreductase [Lewinella sp. W8]
MITVISGTNRSGSRTLLFANYFHELLISKGVESQLLDLTKLPLGDFIPEMYSSKFIAPELKSIQERYVLGAQKLAIFVPEYNGSYPGVLKLFIDGISVNEYPKNFKNKAVALIGVASGRAGNLRGMDHLGDTIAHMGGWVLPNKLPLSSVEQLLDDQDRLVDADTISVLDKHANQLIATDISA